MTSARLYAVQSPEALVEAVAQEALAALDQHCQLTPFSERHPGFDLDLAYAAAACVREARQARGENVVGRKIGFTNARIWDEYGVHAPIYGDMYDTTVLKLDDPQQPVSLAPFLEPRLEPEIAFKLARAPEPGMDEAALLGCMAWMAHGCEIVQSLFPGWRFSAVDTVAAFGLHAAFLIGPKYPIHPDNSAELLDRLGAFRIALKRDGILIDEGHAMHVLGGPLCAVRHLNDLLNGSPLHHPLAAGEIVTTGTLTRAFPIAPGEVWTTALEGLPLDGLTVRFA